MVLSAFMPSVTGMEAQAHALEQVSTNIANMTTVGYKSNETLFYTMLGSQPTVKSNQSGLSSSRVDVTGVGYYDRTNVSTQGVVSNSGGSYDVALNGTGNAFFVLSDRYTNDIYYTRAGDFATQTSNGDVYLVSKNGLRVQGFPALEDGSFGSSLEDIIIKYPEKIPSTPTTEVQITSNVPADGVETSSYGITVYGPNNDGRTMNMLFSKVEGKTNTWDVTFTIEDGTVVTAEPIEAVFNPDGTLLSPKDFNLTVNWDDGSSNNIAMNIENMTQYAGSSGITNVKQDGKESGNFLSSSIGEGGVVVAKYSNGKTLNIAKLAVASFQAPDNLTPISGTLFEANANCGEVSFTEDDYVVPQALEQSTASAETEFSKMMIVQRAYALNSSSFTVNDEMLQIAVNLKT